RQEMVRHGLRPWFSFAHPHFGPADIIDVAADLGPVTYAAPRRSVPGSSREDGSDNIPLYASEPLGGSGHSDDPFGPEKDGFPRSAYGFPPYPYRLSQSAANKLLCRPLRV